MLLLRLFLNIVLPPSQLLLFGAVFSGFQLQKIKTVFHINKNSSSFSEQVSKLSLDTKKIIIITKNHLRSIGRLFASKMYGSKTGTDKFDRQIQVVDPEPTDKVTGFVVGVHLNGHLPLKALFLNKQQGFVAVLLALGRGQVSGRRSGRPRTADAAQQKRCQTVRFRNVNPEPGSAGNEFDHGVDPLLSLERCQFQFRSGSVLKPPLTQLVQTGDHQLTISVTLKGAASFLE